MPNIDSQFVSALRRDILAQVTAQVQFAKSDLFKLMLSTFKRQPAALTNQEGTPDYWEGVSPKNVELFFQVMSEPEFAGGSMLLDFNAPDDEILPIPDNIEAKEESFERHGVIVTVNWDTFLITLTPMTR